MFIIYSARDWLDFYLYWKKEENIVFYNLKLISKNDIYNF